MRKMIRDLLDLLSSSSSSSSLSSSLTLSSIPFILFSAFLAAPLLPSKLAKPPFLLPPLAFGCSSSSSSLSTTLFLFLVLTFFLLAFSSSSSSDSASWKLKDFLTFFLGLLTLSLGLHSGQNQSPSGILLSLGLRQ